MFQKPNLLNWFEWFATEFDLNERDVDNAHGILLTR